MLFRSPKEEDDDDDLASKSYNSLKEELDTIISENKPGARPKAIAIIDRLGAKVSEDLDKPEIIHDILYSTFNFYHGDRKNEPNNEEKIRLLLERIEGSRGILQFLHR